MIIMGFIGLFVPFVGVIFFSILLVGLYLWMSQSSNLDSARKRISIEYREALEHDCLQKIGLHYPNLRFRLTDMMHDSLSIRVEGLNEIQTRENIERITEIQNRMTNHVLDYERFRENMEISRDIRSTNDPSAPMEQGDVLPPPYEE